MAEKLTHHLNAVSPLLVVGSVAYDTVETPSARASRVLGGSASYGALAATYFTTPRMLGVVGHDFAPGDLQLLSRQGVDLEGLQVDASGPTFHWSGVYSERFKERRTTEIHLNVFERFRPILPPSWRGTEYALLGNIHPDLQAHVLGQLEAPAPFVATDTIDLWIHHQREALMEVVRRVQLFIINDSEAELLTGEGHPWLAAERLLADGPQALIIKRGEHGACLFHPQGVFCLPAFPVTDLRDPTGAGDSFAGALMGYLAATGGRGFEAIKEAMVYATAVASLTVESFSCERLLNAGAPAIEARRRDLLGMTQLAPGTGLSAPRN